VTFTLAADAGSEVYVAGDFNGWDPADKKLADKKGNGVYSAVIMLAPGEYEYKFVINGTWCVDPNCKEWRQNSLGTLNSVLRV
jgi:1,4-alpha-glucan branching enzyme